MSDIELARNALAQGHTCAVARGGRLLYAAEGIGVKPLLAALDASPADLKDSAVADTVVGKAAAVILVVGGAKTVHGEVMSRVAADYLNTHGVEYTSSRLVPNISNRTGDGICPLEQSVAGIDDPNEGLLALRERIKTLMAAKVAQTI
ncbi:MAG TPA: DUF1893 domain-containing protein [Terriglobales bacterium]|nr:DUF1893 domain-containing protein [Terriglobales bacterium]